MPISKVNYSLSGSVSASTGDYELPEADRYDSKITFSYAVNGDRDGTLEPDQLKRSTADGAQETFIEREIREQREREKELAATRHLLAQAPPPSSSSSSAFNDSPPLFPQTTSAAAAAAAAEEDHVDWNGSRDEPIEDREADRDATTTTKQKVAAVEVDDVPPRRSGDVNPGENLIVRELLEQQRREEELRQHWKEMGIELNDYRHDDYDEDDVDYGYVDSGDRSSHELRSDAALAVPDRRSATVARDAGQQQQQSLQHAAAEVRREPEPRIEVLSSPPVLPSTPPPSAADQRREKTIDIGAANRSKSSVDACPPETPSKFVRKVLPLPDDDEAGIGGEATLQPLTPAPFAPTNETMMERELRAAREREEALRLLRGLPLNAHDEQLRRSRPVEIEVEVKVRSERPLRRSKSDATDGLLSSAGGRQLSNDRHLSQQQQPAPTSASVNSEAKDDDMFAKRFAESRLKAELLRQRQRELDLRSSGLIHTISDERAGDPLKYVEVVVSTSGTTSTNDTASVKRQVSSPPGALTREKTATSEPVPRVAEAEISEVDGRVPPTTKATPPENVESPKTTTIATPKTDKATAAPSASETPRRELPLVLRTYSYPVPPEDDNVSSNDTKSTTSKLSSEARILEEVAECRRREEELRTLRERLRLQVSTDASVAWERPPESSPGSHAAPAASAAATDSVDSHPASYERFDEDEGSRRGRDDDEFLGQSGEPLSDVTSPLGGIRRRLALIDEWERMSFAASSQP